MRRMGLVANTVGALCVLAPIAGAQESNPDAAQESNPDAAQESSPGAAQEIDLEATMTAEEVAPQPGPSGADGSVELTYTPADSMLCYDFSLGGLDARPSGASIHQGAPGTVGPEVIDLRFNAHGEEGCIPVEQQTMQAVAADHANHYVSVATRDHPDGAIRGQLEADE